MNPAQRKQVIAVGVLGVVLLAVLVYQFLGSSKPTGSAKAKQEAAATAAAKPAAGSKTAASRTGAGEEKVEFKMSDVNLAELQTRVEELQFDYVAHKMPRDPMRPLIEAPIKDKKKGAKQVATAKPVLLPGGSGFQDEMIKNAILEKSVTGIVWDPNTPCAVVDNKILFVGSQLPVLVGAQEPVDLTVVAIGPDSVTFRGGNIELPVRLKE